MLTVMRAAFLGAFGTVFVAATPSLAQETNQPDTDILKIFDRFVVTEIIGTRCGNFDAELQKKYQVNFMTVMPAAMVRIGEMKPHFTQEQRLTVLNHRQKMLRRGVVSQIEELGCQDQSFQNLLALYRIHADMDLFANPQ